MRAFCIECGRHIEYKIIWHTVQTPSRSFRELAAICLECGKEVYAPEVNDVNVGIRKGVAK